MLSAEKFKVHFHCLTVFSPTDDDNRIVLQPISGREDCQSDYINACYVDVSVHVHVQVWPG